MFEVRIEPINEVLEVEEDQTILDAILRAGLHIPYQCNHGLCSTCKINVLEGDFEHGEASPFALLDFEREEGVALACCATPQSDMVIEADIEEEPDARSIPIQDFEATVERIENLSPRVKGVWLRTQEPVDFQAGQYVNLFVPGVENGRAFSIASTPSDPTLIELHISLVMGGQATTYVHETLAEGDSLKFTAPLGRFILRTSRDKPLLFIAGGSGLSSPKSMVEDILASGFEKPVYLFHGARDLSELYYFDHFNDLAQKYSNFTYLGALSDPKTSDLWTGATGFVHEAVTEYFDGAFVGLNAYICGPPPMIEASIRALMKGRLFEKDIFTEKFLSQADGSEAARSSKVFKRI